jgi:predicted HTH domain antitoxin
MARSETVDADEDDLAYAIGRYALGGISIGKAASLARIDRWTMIDVLEEAGVEVRLGPQSVEDARREAAVALGEDPDEYLARFNDEPEADSADE